MLLNGRARFVCVCVIFNLRFSAVEEYTVDKKKNVGSENVEWQNINCFGKSLANMQLYNV